MSILEKLLGREFPRAHDVGSDGKSLPTTHEMSAREKLSMLFDEKVAFPVMGVGAMIAMTFGRNEP